MTRSTKINVTYRDLITPVTIEKASYARGGTGGRTLTWTPLITRVYCADVQKPLSSLQEGGKLVTVILHHIFIRYRPNHGIFQGQRVNFGDGIFVYIQSVDNVEQKNIWLRLVCSEVEPTLGGNI
jgi:hypothetical protein